MKNYRLSFISLGLAALGVLTMSSCKDDPKDPAPIASFEVASEGKIVSFTNTSENATSYLWDFGDASDPSVEENPVHEYEAYGDYDVRLTATGPGGEIIEKKAISIVKEWPTIEIDGDFSDWDNVEIFYAGGEGTGVLYEAKVTSDPSLTKLYVYIKGDINADNPVLQLMFDADLDTLTGWSGNLYSGYALDGSDYSLEWFVNDNWATFNGYNTEAPSWPWSIKVIDDDVDPGKLIPETSGVVNGELEFYFDLTNCTIIPASNEGIRLYFWVQNSGWSTSGWLPALEVDGVAQEPKVFSFQ